MTEDYLDREVWRTSHPLNEFMNKLRSMNPEDLKGTKQYEFVLTRFHNKVWDIIATRNKISWIVERLNEDISLISNSYKDKKKPYPFGTLSYASIDVESFILFTRILMDKIARLIYSVIRSEKKPSSTSFNDWYKKVSHYQGEKAKELIDLFNSAVWFKDLKDLRDDYVMHRGISLGGVGGSPNIHDEGYEISFHLVKHEKMESKMIYIQDINEMSKNLHIFLEDLNNFLCRNFSSLPLKLIYE